MRRLGALFWLALVVAAGFTTFKVKYAVQDLEDELNRVRKQTIAEQQEIRVLTAEWTYLTQPERLAELNRRFLSLAPIATKQLQRPVAEIALRPPAAADTVIAAQPDIAEPATPATALPIAPASLGPAQGGPAAVVRLAKAGSSQPAPSLDALIAQIAETR
jgi:hypothetical protein